MTPRRRKPGNIEGSDPPWCASLAANNRHEGSVPAGAQMQAMSREHGIRQNLFLRTSRSPMTDRREGIWWIECSHDFILKIVVDEYQMRA